MPAAIITVLALTLSLLFTGCGGGTHQGEALIVVGRPIVSYEIPYVNDHSVIYNPGDQKWHMFGIVGDQKRFMHLTAASLTQTPWERHEDFLTGDGDKEIWAPHIIRHDGLFYMFYTMIGVPREIRYAVSTDLHGWSHPSADPLLALATESGNDRKNKDPMVFRDGDRWVMY